MARLKDGLRKKRLGCTSAFNLETYRMHVRDKYPNWGREGEISVECTDGEWHFILGGATCTLNTAL
eukprot:3536571-Pyramimonas_sp.AAC.2